MGEKNCGRPTKRICTSCLGVQQFQRPVPWVRDHTANRFEMEGPLRGAGAFNWPQSKTAYISFSDTGSGRAADSDAQSRKPRVGCKDTAQSAGRPGRAGSALCKNREQYPEPSWLYQPGRIPETAAVHSLREGKMQHDVANGLQGRIPYGRPKLLLSPYHHRRSLSFFNQSSAQIKYEKCCNSGVSRGICRIWAARFYPFR